MPRPDPSKGINTVSRPSPPAWIICAIRAPRPRRSRAAGAAGRRFGCRLSASTAPTGCSSRRQSEH
eukprot:352932-Chlamydomonas_euryale.AAC.9